MGKIKLVSSDLNGTLVHQHTMSDMIRLYIGESQFQKATEVFQRQTSGQATMEEAFEIAGPLTKGLTLRQAIEYTQQHMRYVIGFNKFVDFIYGQEIPFVINSTGYSVTIYAIKEQIKRGRIHGQIGNILHFGLDGDKSQILREDELELKVREFINDSEAKKKTVYDRVSAIGEITLGIKDESAKAVLINKYTKMYFPQVTQDQIAHVGDTMGDSKGILDIAKQGGIGIAFNYNNTLKNYLMAEMIKEQIQGQIYFIDPKDDKSDLKRVVEVLK
ncbi:MAG: hypothetical protein AABW91_03450 [Nanoarchaeota archaeon]